MKTERIICYWLTSGSLKSRANVFPASLNYLHHFAIPVLQQPSNQKVSFPLVWHVLSVDKSVRVTSNLLLKIAH